MTLVQGLCHHCDVPSPRVLPFLGRVLGSLGSAEAWRHQDIPRAPVLALSVRGGVAVLGLDMECVPWPSASVEEDGLSPTKPHGQGGVF